MRDPPPRGSNLDSLLTPQNNVEQVIHFAGRYAMYPITLRKNRSKKCHVALRSAICEFYKNIKEYQKGIRGNICIDLRKVFNVSEVIEPNTLKDRALAIMTPNETYYLSLEKNPTISFTRLMEEVIDRCREGRSDRLARPVFREEYFEACWDVMVVPRPQMPSFDQVVMMDLPLKYRRLMGRKRLVMLSESMVLFHLSVEPKSDGTSDDAFYEQDYDDFPINIISSYGKIDKYFFLRAGRCSEYGPGECWMMTESKESAQEMHKKIVEIHMREAEKRRAQGIKLTIPGISTRVVRNRVHKEEEAHEEELAACEEEHLQKEAKYQEDQKKLAEEEQHPQEIEEPHEEEVPVQVQGDDKEPKKKTKFFWRKKKERVVEKNKENDKTEPPPKKASLMGFKLPKTLSISSAMRDEDKKTVPKEEETKKQLGPLPQEDYLVSNEPHFNTVRKSEVPLKMDMPRIPPGFTSHVPQNLANTFTPHSPVYNGYMIENDEYGTIETHALPSVSSMEHCTSPQFHSSSFSSQWSNPRHHSNHIHERSSGELKQYGHNNRAYSVGSRPDKVTRNPQTITPPTLHTNKGTPTTGSVNTVDSIKEEDEGDIYSTKKKRRQIRVELARTIREAAKKDEPYSKAAMRAAKAAEQRDKPTDLLSDFRIRAHSYESGPYNRKALMLKKLLSQQRFEPTILEPTPRDRIGSNDSTISNMSLTKNYPTLKVCSEDEDFAIGGPSKRLNSHRIRATSFGKTVAEITRMSREAALALKNSGRPHSNWLSGLLPPHDKKITTPYMGVHQPSSMYELKTSYFEEKDGTKILQRRRSTHLVTSRGLTFRFIKPYFNKEEIHSDSEIDVPTKRQYVKGISERTVRKEKRKKQRYDHIKEALLIHQIQFSKNEEQLQKYITFVEKEVASGRIPTPDYEEFTRELDSNRLSPNIHKSNLRRNDSSCERTSMRPKKSNSESMPKKSSVNEVQLRRRTMTSKYNPEDRPGPSGLNKQVSPKRSQKRLQMMDYPSNYSMKTSAVSTPADMPSTSKSGVVERQRCQTMLSTSPKSRHINRISVQDMDQPSSSRSSHSMANEFQMSVRSYDGQKPTRCATMASAEVPRKKMSGVHKLRSEFPDGRKSPSPSVNSQRSTCSTTRRVKTATMSSQSGKTIKMAARNAAEHVRQLDVMGNQRKLSSSSQRGVKNLLQVKRKQSTGMRKMSLVNDSKHGQVVLQENVPEDSNQVNYVMSDVTQRGSLVHPSHVRIVGDRKISFVHQNSVTKLRPSISVSANPLRKYSRECKHAAKKAKATNKDYVLVRTTSKKKKNKIDRDTHYPTSTDENSDCSCCSTDEMMKRARANKKSVPTRY